MGKKNEEEVITGILVHFGEVDYEESMDFAFDTKDVTLKWWQKYKNNEITLDEYKKIACDLMFQHNQFYKQIKLVEKEYAERGAILLCTHGSRPTKLDECVGHGVVIKNNEVMTCNSCKVNENIFSFGACGNGLYEPLYCKEAPHPAQLSDDWVHYICFPILLREWGYGALNDRKDRADIKIAEPHIEAPQLEGFLQHGDENGEEYVDALLTEYNLLCLYGGVITIEENPEPEEIVMIEESTEWIPEESMKLNGNTLEEEQLTKRIDEINEACGEEYKWNQEKIDLVWAACEEFYEEYGVQVDPRLLLSIIGTEGTGSFNTNSKDLAGDGQNGPQKIFEADLENAVDFVGGKIIAYAYYKEAFSASREKAYQEGLEGIKDYDDILHYINWQTPRVSTITSQITPGVYAGDNTWNSSVRQIYGEIAFDGAAGKYTEYALSLGADKLKEVAQELGIEIPSMQFKAVRNKQDLKKQYTIIAEETAEN